jgi:hypothetical protein
MKLLKLHFCFIEGCLFSHMTRAYLTSEEMAVVRLEQLFKCGAISEEWVALRGAHV